MSYENELVTGVAELLAAAGVAVWDPSGMYPNTGSLPAIFVQAVPDVPRPIVVLSPYPAAGALDPNDSVLGLQVRTRAEGADPRACNDLDGAVYDALHGQRGIALGEYRVTKILFQSGASLGQDDSGRWGRSTNYYLTGPR